MPDAVKLKERPRVNVSIAHIHSWRCCPWNIDTQTKDDDCCPNNIAYDNIRMEIMLVQMPNTTSAWYYAPYDTYYVDVFIKDPANTDYKIHTHEVIWQPYTHPGRLPDRGTRRTWQISCRNVLNGVTKCGRMAPPNGDRPEGDPSTFEEYKEYEVALRVRCHRDLTAHPSHEGITTMVCAHEGPPYEMTGEDADGTWCVGEMK